MQVTLERGGGVTGASNHQRLGPLDAGVRAEGPQIEKLVADADFFEISDEFPGSPVKSDPTWTTIRVVDGDADRTIRWDSNQTIPDPLRALLDLCSSLGEWERVQ